MLDPIGHFIVDLVDTFRSKYGCSMETEQKKLKRPRRSFSDDFKAGAVRLVLEEGKSVAQVSKHLDLTASALGKWVEQARADQGKSKRGTLTTEEKEELTRLRKENRELRLEREILKKAPLNLPIAVTSNVPRAPIHLRGPWTFVEKPHSPS